MSASLAFQNIVSGLMPTGGSKTGSDAGAEIASPSSVPAAQPATLTTRVSNVAGTLTMTNVNHGIITGQRIDLYWPGGSCFGVTAGTVSGTSVPFTRVQGGNFLPIATTAIKVGIPTSAPFELNGDNISALVCDHATAQVRSYFVFVNLLSVLALAILNQANQIYVWDNTSGITGPVGSSAGPIGSNNFNPAPINPLGGTNPVLVWISHEDTVAADTGLFCMALKH